MNVQIGKIFIIAGIIFLIIGIILVIVPNKLSLISWFGKLPGDIRIINDNSKVFIPVTSMLLISVVLTVLLNVFKRLFF